MWDIVRFCCDFVTVLFIIQHEFFLHLDLITQFVKCVETFLIILSNIQRKWFTNLVPLKLACALNACFKMSLKHVNVKYFI